MFYFDSTILLLIPAAIFAFYAQTKVKSAYSKYAKIKVSRGMTGYEVARRILDVNGLQNVEIEEVAGILSDHYDPRGRKVRLSGDVYHGTSIASVSVAAHETGHAIQHKIKHPLLAFRSAVVPFVNVGSMASWPLMIIGLLLANGGNSGLGLLLMDAGIVFFSVVVVFHGVTLPVEFDASNRALEQMDSLGLVREEELIGAKTVLSAAAMTYVAALATAIMNLVRLLILRDRNS